MHGSTHHIDGADVAIVATIEQLVRVAFDALCVRAVDGDVLHVDCEQHLEVGVGKHRNGTDLGGARTVL